MQFEMNHKIGTDYSTVNFYNISKLTEESRIKLYEVLNKLGMTFGKEDEIRFPKWITSEVLSEVIHNTCYVCGGLMKDGQAIQEGKIYVSSYDSAIETYQGEIEYPNPLGSKIINVRKCSSCGHSHT